MIDTYTLEQYGMLTMSQYISFLAKENNQKIYREDWIKYREFQARYQEYPEVDDKVGCVFCQMFLDKTDYKIIKLFENFITTCATQALEEGQDFLEAWCNDNLLLLNYRNESREFLDARKEVQDE